MKLTFVKTKSEFVKLKLRFNFLSAKLKLTLDNLSFNLICLDQTNWLNLNSIWQLNKSDVVIKEILKFDSKNSKLSSTK